MRAREIRRILSGLKKGDEIPRFIPMVGGHKVSEVVDYKLRSAPWCDVLCRVNRTKIAMEFTDGENMVKLWGQIKLPLPAKPATASLIVFKDGRYSWQEGGLPEVAIAGEDEGLIHYEVFVNKSGGAICVEWWPGEEPEAYELLKEIPFSEIVR